MAASLIKTIVLLRLTTALPRNPSCTGYSATIYMYIFNRPPLVCSRTQSYQPHVPEEHRAWPFRKDLMREYLLRMDADVVCVQEASAETFEDDFDFMKAAG